MVTLPFGRLSNCAPAASGGKCGCGPLGRGNYKILDIRIGAGFYPALSALRLRRPHFFQQRKKWRKERRQNQWFLEFLSSDCSCGAKRFRNESPLRLPSLPLTGHAESNGRPPVWAIIKSRACRQRRQVWVRPAGPRSEARNIPFENKSAGRCGRRVRALRPPVRKKERPPKRSFFLVQN